MKQKLFLIILISAILLTTICACGKSEPEETPTPEIPVETVTPIPATEAPTMAPTPAPTPITFQNPLTGETIEEDISNRRPYAVMINNISVAMPHVGTSHADMIVEEMDEGGITRCMAFFTDISGIEKIGSIRSARAYNVRTAYGYDAILVRAGGSGEADRLVNSLGVNDVDGVHGSYVSGTFFRDESRMTHGYEHSLFAVGDQVIETAIDHGYREEHEEGYDTTYGLSFSEDAVKQCTENASRVKVVYSGGKRSIFDYDEDTKTYTFTQYDEVYTDDGETVPTFSNVIVIYANTFLQSDGVHLTIELENGGDGYFCTGGKYVPITYTKDGEDAPFHFFLEDGTPLQLSIGKTFICVNQSGSYQGSVEFENE